VSSSATQHSSCTSVGRWRNPSGAAKAVLIPQTTCGESCAWQGEARKLLCVHTLCLREGQGALKCTLKSRRVLLLSNCNPSTKSFKYQKAFLYPYMMLSYQPSPSIEKEVNFKLWLSHHSQTSQPTEGSDFSSMTGSSQELSSSNSTTLQ